MIKVILSGCNGKMGRNVTARIAQTDGIEIVAGVDTYTETANDYPVFKAFSLVKDIEADVVIDFSNADALSPILTYCLAEKVALVACTTGYSAQQINELKSASEKIPVFFSANMSLGVNLIVELSKTAAKVLGNDFDIEIVEAHHNQKLDAPSGTALMLANAINAELDSKYDYEYNRHEKREKRPKNEIGIHSVRGGTIVGEHEVIFAGDDEIIKISHSARSKALFATGAVNAAIFVCGRKPGLYAMADMLNQQ